MITAKLGNGIINCFDGTYTKEDLKKWAKKKIVLCPACGKPYEYCHGKVNNPYFRHMDKQECEDKYSEPETEEHIQGKILLFEWVKSMDGVSDVMLEGWLPETKQRPDIMFKHDGKQYVLEFQATPIASEYIERHELYHAAGIRDIWILGTEKYKFNILGHPSTHRHIYDCGVGFFNWKTKEILIKSSDRLFHHREIKNNTYKYCNLNLFDTKINFNHNTMCLHNGKLALTNNFFNSFVYGILDSLNSNEGNTYSLEYCVPNKKPLAKITHVGTKVYFLIKKDEIKYFKRTRDLYAGSFQFNLRQSNTNKHSTNYLDAVCNYVRLNVKNAEQQFEVKGEIV